MSAATEPKAHASAYQRLRQQLHSRLEVEAFTNDRSHKAFIPENCLRELLTEGAIISVLSESGSEAEVHYVFEYGIRRIGRVFATLVYMVMDESYICKTLTVFIRCGVDDSRLPISYLELSNGIRDHLAHPPVWAVADGFCATQHRFLAPVLSSSTISHKFDSRTVLPFVKRQRVVSEDATLVGLIEVHPSHFVHNEVMIPYDQQRSFIAVKQRNESSRWDYDGMVNRLLAINKVNHDRIAKFITAVQTTSTNTDHLYYFLFRDSDGGCLPDLWKAKPTPDTTAPFVRAVFEQLFGLVEALNAVYQESSHIHGQIRPESITWIPGPLCGTLKLGAWEQWDGVHGKNHDARYRRPGETEPSRAGDLWAFGCIALQMLAWVMYGKPELHHFQSNPVNQGKEIDVPPVLALWMNAMENEPACAVGVTAAGDFLSIIRSDLLRHGSLRKHPSILRDLTTRKPYYKYAVIYVSTVVALVFPPGPLQQLMVLKSPAELSTRSHLTIASLWREINAELRKAVSPDARLSDVWSRLSRRRPSWGYTRIEWRCDCGHNLYADLPRRYGTYIDDLESSLQSHGCSTTSQSASAPSVAGKASLASSSASSPNSRPAFELSRPLKSNNKLHNDSQTAQSGTVGASGKRVVDAKPKFLALCVNQKENYQVLCEIDMSNISSDAAMFEEMKRQYHLKRGRWARLNWLVKVKDIEYITFKFWNYEESWITVCKRPNEMPSQPHMDYEETPIVEAPPMPANVFIHYLEHGPGALNKLRDNWRPLLPKRNKKHDAKCYAYGIHLIEGPYKKGIFMFSIAFMIVTVGITVGYSIAMKDVQGGTGIGAFIMACYAVYLTAWVIWRSA